MKIFLFIFQLLFYIICTSITTGCYAAALDESIAAFAHEALAIIKNERAYLDNSNSINNEH